MLCRTMARDMLMKIQVEMAVAVAVAVVVADRENLGT